MTDVGGWFGPRLRHILCTIIHEGLHLATVICIGGQPNAY